MTVEEALVTDPVMEAPRGHRRARVRAGLRKPSNWLQLIRFATVGASGYVVNLGVFTLLVHQASVDYRLAAVGAFLVALANNFAWNRGWTFADDASDGHAGFQALRFCVVSLVAFAFNLVALFALVEWLGVAEVPAQAIAIAAGTPLNFLGNKLWSFAS
jgi:dolichol-phosphate mannosyltransferase